jgi:hypothetical protein
LDKILSSSMFAQQQKEKEEDNNSINYVSKTCLPCAFEFFKNKVLRSIQNSNTICIIVSNEETHNDI